MDIKSVFSKITSAVGTYVFPWVKSIAVQLVVEAEKSMPGKTGKEKRAWVVQKIDDMIKLPLVLEFIDGPVAGVIVDAVCDKLNLLTDHQIAAVDASTPIAAATVAAVTDASAEAIVAAKAVATSVDDRIKALAAKIKS